MIRSSIASVRKVVAFVETYLSLSFSFLSTSNANELAIPSMTCDFARNNPEGDILFLSKRKLLSNISRYFLSHCFTNFLLSLSEFYITGLILRKRHCGIFPSEAFVKREGYQKARRRRRKFSVLFSHE